MEYKHVPVMLKEVIEYLSLKQGQYCIDGTLGGGGYTKVMLEKVGSKGGVIAIDLDDLAIENAKKKFNKNKNIRFVHDNYRNLKKIINDNYPFIFEERRGPAKITDQISTNEKVKSGNAKFSGIVLDLGLSSAQLEDRDRGFSFQMVDAPINMAFGQSETTVDTEYIINKYSEREIRQILTNYGEEKFAWKISKQIVSSRVDQKIKTVGDLIEIIKKATPPAYQRGKIHFATKTFQALRIATNDELNGLKDFLPQAINSLVSGGRLVIISFHSLEDRIVKDFFRENSRDCICPPELPVCCCDHKASLKILTKKPISPSIEEVQKNPRSRSAKLRVAEKI